ncbi:MAG: CheR family methyltransferase [Candidatus Hodarchaeota archaeon]
MEDNISDWVLECKQRRERLAKLRTLMATNKTKGVESQELLGEEDRDGSPLLTPKAFPDEHILPILMNYILQMGFDIFSYKEKYLKRRLRILLRNSDTVTYSDYLAKLRKDPKEFERLKRAFSINVTRFFRDFEEFKRFREIVFSKLFSQKLGEIPVRIWSAGCAMGPEPYTLAMLVHNYRSTHSSSRKAQIIATDLNPDLLQIAAIGEYSKDALEETPPEFQLKYFKELEEGRMGIKPPIKAMVQFKQHDLLSSDSIGEFDVIVCRNVLMYFDRDQQDKIYKLFADSLAPGGFLFLGSVEILLRNYRGIFMKVEGHQHLYKRV